MAGLFYPADINSSTYAGSSVIFFINTHQDTKFAPSQHSQPTFGEIPPAPPRGNALRINEGQATLMAGAAGGAAGVGLAATMNGMASGAGVPLTGKAATLTKMVGGGAGAAAGIAMAKDVLGPGMQQKSYTRMANAIQLHMPTDLQIKYTAQWSEDNQAGMQALANDQNTGAGLQSYVTGLALDTDMGKFFGKAGGVASNPKKEQLFRNVEFRQFSFSYQFFARDAAEVENIKAIIYEFKFHMHPEFKSGSENFLYVYPSEFEIYYWHGGQNQYIHKHTACVLTDMNVSYTPNGVWSVFDSGSPTQINMQLTFRELALLTKEDIAEGY